VISYNSIDRLPLALLLLRLGVAAVMIPWSIDKIVNPDHASAVFANFYFISGLGASAFLVLGIAELLIVLAFLAGIAKKWTYGAVLIMHAVSTFASWQQYLDFQLLFFAAWPMLAACVVLFMFRNNDTMLTVAR
jgi:putative oxidoreductase